MTRTLYLHLGPAKTGTSAIQHVLCRHDGSAILYPRVGLWSDGSHHNLVLNFFGDGTRPETVREDKAQLLARIGEAASRTDRDVVISSEILAGRRHINEFIDSLKSAIGGPVRVVLVAVVRDHFERAASSYNQRVKDAAFLERRDPDDFLVGQAAQLCYAHLLRRLSRSGHALEVLNYHPAETLVARCLALFGFAPESIPESPRRNVSLGRKALIATLAANRASEAVADRSRFDSALVGLKDRFAATEIVFGPEAIAKIRPIFAADRKYLRKSFELRLPRGRARDAVPFALSGEEIAEIAAAMRPLGDDGQKISDIVLGYSTSAHIREYSGVDG